MWLISFSEKIAQILIDWWLFGTAKDERAYMLTTSIVTKKIARKIFVRNVLKALQKREYCAESAEFLSFLDILKI